MYSKQSVPSKNKCFEFRLIVIYRVVRDRELLYASMDRVQVTSPKSAVEASALKQAKEDGNQLLAQLQRLCLERGLVLFPGGPGSAIAGKGCPVP